MTTATLYITQLLKINVVGEFHVLCVDAQDLKATCGVGNTNGDFPAKGTESSKGRVEKP